jgi:hypothetical protein
MTWFKIKDFLLRLFFLFSLVWKQNMSSQYTVELSGDVLAVKIGDDPEYYLTFDTRTGRCNCLCHTGGCFWAVERQKREKQLARKKQHQHPKSRSTKNQQF